jgi:hypothetical protein
MNRQLPAAAPSAADVHLPDLWHFCDDGAVWTTGRLPLSSGSIRPPGIDADARRLL